MIYQVQRLILMDDLWFDEKIFFYNAINLDSHTSSKPKNVLKDISLFLYQLFSYIKLLIYMSSVG